LLRWKLGLSDPRKVPMIFVENASFIFPPFAIKKLWKMRKFTVMDKNDKKLLIVDKQQIEILPGCLRAVIYEWEEWEEYYLPKFSIVGKTVLDVGAGCGETALLFFLHGAEKVIAIEPSFEAVECLKRNRELNNWNIEIVPRKFCLAHLDFNYHFMKMDCDGCESLLLTLPQIKTPSVIEVHNRKLKMQFEQRGWRTIHSFKGLRALICSDEQMHLLSNSKV
jgi:SAM-dependent methyltransferase